MTNARNAPMTAAWHVPAAGSAPRAWIAVLPLAIVVALTALMLSPDAAHAQAQPQQLGRLFYTPDQRAEMDRRRDTPPQPVTAATVAPAPVIDMVTVNGRVSRSSGKSTTWINGVPQDDAFPGSDASRVTLSVPGDTGSTPVKVGETLDRLKGEKRDGLDGGRVGVRGGNTTAARPR